MLIKPTATTTFTSSTNPSCETISRTVCRSFEQGEVESTRANQFAELFGVGHKEGLHHRIDHPSRAQKTKNSYFSQPVFKAIDGAC